MSATAPTAGPATAIRNGEAIALDAIEPVPAAELATRVAAECRDGARLAALTAIDVDGGHALVSVLMRDLVGQLALLRTPLARHAVYPAITPLVPAAHVLERLLHEEHGLVPSGHPWLKPVRRHRELEPAPAVDGTDHPFLRLDGPGVHEVAVGPVHAGIIEPGHFRFQCSGELVHHLEIQLGYQRRGVEALLGQGSPARRLVVAESIAGDTAIGHTLAHCMIVEALADAEVPLAAQAVRGLALELERLANHVGDLGALCNDVAYLPGASWFGRLRGEFLNLLLALSGNRFGRGLLLPGGVRRGLDDEARQRALAALDRAERDLRQVAALTFDTPSVLSRFERTGSLDHALAEQIGLTGPVARACGCDRDARRDHAHGIYRFHYLPVATTRTGDVMGRALVRWLEVERSLTFCREQLRQWSGGPLSVPVGPAPGDRLAVALVEGWRGTIVHVALAGANDALAAYQVVDPSVHNWFGLALALRGNQISDFPLCNKSFNLSYAGHDL